MADSITLNIYDRVVIDAGFVVYHFIYSLIEILIKRGSGFSDGVIWKTALSDMTTRHKLHICDHITGFNHVNESSIFSRVPGCGLLRFCNVLDVSLSDGVAEIQYWQWFWLVCAQGKGCGVFVAFMATVCGAGLDGAG